MSELQSILDASDSSDDDVTGEHQTQYSSLEPSLTTKRFPTDGSDIDLEQILREDDDDEEEEDYDEFHDARLYGSNEQNGDETFEHGRSASSNGGVAGMALGGQRSRSSGRAGSGMASSFGYSNTLMPPSSRGISASDPDDEDVTMPSMFSGTAGVTTTSTQLQHNEEDWAVLQAILREDDDEDDDEDDEDMEDTKNRVSMGVTNKFDDIDDMLDLKFSKSKDKHYQKETKEDVETMQISPLQPTTAKDILPTMAAFPPPTSPDIEDILAQSTEDDIDLNVNFDHIPRGFGRSLRHYPNDIGYSTNTSNGGALTRPSLSMDQHNASGSGEDNITAQNIAAAELSDEEASRRALEQAQTYERRLLKAGHRDIVSPLMVKRRLKPKVSLAKRPDANDDSCGEQSGQSSRAGPRTSAASASATTSPEQRFHTSGLIENTRLPEISTSITKHADVDAKVKCGLPTCVSFNSRFIAVGTQLGIVLLFDLFGALRQRLGASYLEDQMAGMRMVGSITSIDLNYSGECCAVGYKSGMIVLWDTIRGTVLRSVDDLHPSPIISIRFYADLKLVSADAGGLVNKATFTKNLLWSTYSYETDCLLDGTAGQILAVNVLEPYTVVPEKFRPKSAAMHRALRSFSFIALSSERSSFAVAVEPKVNVLHRWPRPPKERVDVIHPSRGSVEDSSQSVYLPCLAWGWTLTSGGGNVAMPMLARSWGCCLQLLNSSIPTLDDQSTPAHSEHTSGEEATIHWPAFGMHEEFDAEAPIVSLEWLSERSLVYLTMTNELTVVDTVVMTLLERLDFSGMRVVFADFALSRTAARVMTGRDDEGGSEEHIAQITCTTFQNSVRCNDKRLMVLCQNELRQITMVSSRQRITSMEADGEWLEALALALDYYEGTFSSQENRRRDPNGRRDLSRHPEFSTPKDEEEEWIAKLLMRYLNLAVDNAPISASDDNLISLGNGRARINLAQSHFQMLAGVCVEYCVTTRRLDLLFGPIFRRFQSVGYTAVFLDVLEPYVLNDRLSYIAPEVMSYFVEHCKSNNGVATVERCLLHMDCTIMDFDSIIALLRNNDMYSAMFFVFNQGLNDYVSPLQMLLERVFDEADAGNALVRRSSERKRQNDFDRFGYKAILYLRFCMEGKSFPKEEKILPEEMQASVKPELLTFLTQATYSPPSHAPRKRSGDTAERVGHRSYLYPYMRLLVQVDPSLLFETISTGFSGNASYEQQQEGTVNYPREQEIVDLFTTMIFPELSEVPTEQIKLFKSRQATGAFLDFTAKYITRGLVRANKSLTYLIAKRISDRFAANANNPTARRAAQVQIMELLSALPRESYEPDKVLALIERAGIHRAALLLHQQVASSWQDTTGADDIELRARHFCSAIDCFIDDDDKEFRLEVFDYIRKECTGFTRDSKSGEGNSQRALAHVVYSRFRRLVRLDALMTARLVAELFVEDFDVVVESLEDGDGGEGQFLFLQPIMSGELLEVDPVAGSVLNPSMDHHLKYLSLMAKLHPEQVYEYLSKHDNYRAEDALKLCEQYQIADASAYLLERMGNISSALQLILQTLEGRLMALKRTLRGMELNMLNHHLLRFGPNKDAGINQLPNKQAQEGEGVQRILVVALDLCERNSGSYNSQAEHGSQLWFNVLDRLINAKGFLRLANEQREHARMMEQVLNDLLRLTMQRMVSNVPLLDLVRKVTSDHSGSRLAELREMVMSLVGTYRFELNLFTKAADAFHEDIASMKNSRAGLVKKAASVAKNHLNIPQDDLNSDESTFFIDGETKGIVFDSNGTQSSKQTQSGLKQTLSRLRDRRQASSNTRPLPESSWNDVGAISETDRKYHEGRLEPVVYQHAVGILGEAHHRGRLISFD